MPSMRYPCATPGCVITLDKPGRCAEHRSEAERARGTRQARGYGKEHFHERALWAPKVKAGIVNCARCGQRIQKGELWAQDHTDDRLGYLGPSHLDCNARAGGKASRR